MSLNIVLVEPEIPTNTGNIGRLSLATGSNLHLVKPFGFEIDDKRLKRAGLDYWKHLNVKYYDSFDDFLIQNESTNDRLVMCESPYLLSFYRFCMTKSKFLATYYDIRTTFILSQYYQTRRRYDDSFEHICKLIPHIKALI